MVQLIDGHTPLATARAVLADAYDLAFTPAVARESAPIYERVKASIPAVEWPLYAPLIGAINRLKWEKDAVILAHHYQAPQIFHGVADVTGDAADLAAAAAATDAGVIVQCGVRFMAETSKLLNPRATVLLPDGRAGCSLAASITPADVLAIRAQYPDAKVVAHVNTPAAVKAVSDICCTCSNALDIVSSLDGDTVIMVPDRFLAQNTAKASPKRIITWDGACEVHETFTAADIAELRYAHPAAKILVHPDCRPEVVAAADYSGPASGMIGWVRTERPSQVVMVTECSAADNLVAETEGTEFIRGCNICPHMKRITLENILWSLHTMTEAVTIDATLADAARAAMERMLATARRA